MSTDTAPGTGTQPRASKLGSLGQFVNREVSRLQERYLAGHADAVAGLAKLRRGVGKDVGALPELWQLTLDGVPMPEPQSDLPTREETAAYTAITLYAVHQQSRRQGMHVAGLSLGDAARVLRARAPSAEAVRRRFEALGTAETFAEAVHHARGLVTQFRSHDIPLDYGMLADQLWWLQTGVITRIRLRWGRDFYRSVDDRSGNGDTTHNQASTPAPDAGTATKEEA